MWTDEKWKPSLLEDWPTASIDSDIEENTTLQPFENLFDDEVGFEMLVTEPNRYDSQKNKSNNIEDMK